MVLQLTTKLKFVLLVCCRAICINNVLQKRLCIYKNYKCFYIEYTTSVTPDTTNDIIIELLVVTPFGGIDDYYWGFDNLCINQSFLTTSSPTPASTDFDYTDCPEYLLKLSDYDLLKKYINNSEVDAFVTRRVNGIDRYTFRFNDANKSSEWLLQSSTYTQIQNTSSMVITLKETDNNCRQPIFTLTDDTSFISISFCMQCFFYTLFSSVLFGTYINHRKKTQITNILFIFL